MAQQCPQPACCAASRQLWLDVLPVSIAACADAAAALSPAALLLEGSTCVASARSLCLLCSRY